MSDRERIEISVPALVSEEMFALAQEQLEKNKRHSPRRTVEPTLLQGMLAAAKDAGIAETDAGTQSELQSLKMAAVDEAKYLQLAENLASFRSKLRVRADALDIALRQQILRLLLKEVLVVNDTITLRHSVPIPQSGPGSSGSPAPPSGVTGSKPNPGYLLRSGSLDAHFMRSSAHAPDQTYRRSQLLHWPLDLPAMTTR